MQKIQEEMVAWVDENEQLIKVIPISLANSDPKYLHSEIAGMVVDDQHRVLLQQRAKTKKVLPSLWTITTAGHITYGDTPEQTVHKELKEELGIDVPVFYYLFREKVSLPNETHFCHKYIGKYNGGNIVMQESEVDDYAWVSEAEFTQFIAIHEVSHRTIDMMKRYWSGEWDKILL